MQGRRGGATAEAARVGKVKDRSQVVNPGWWDMDFDCLCAGILVADHVCTPISHMPKAGELVVSKRLVLNIGGNASNTAVNLAKLGAKAGVVGCVGDDIFGGFLCDFLQRAGVDAGGVRKLPGVDTAGTLVVNVQGEDRRFIHAVGANGCFTADDIPLDLVRRSKVLYVGGVLLMQGLDSARLAEKLQAAREAGVTTMVDVVVPGPGPHWESLAPLLPWTDHFLPNVDEGELITGLSDPLAQAERFLEAGAGTVVITCGGEGSVLATRDVRLRAGVFSVPFADGSGAGDAFDAGYIAALLQGLSPVDCLRWGSALGASCVRSVGTTTGVFSRSEAEAFLASHPLPVHSLSRHVGG